MSQGMYDEAIEQYRQQAAQNAAINKMPAKVFFKYEGREFVWATEDTALMAAIDHVFRRRLALGETVFLSSTADAVSGRSHATLVIPPEAWVQFTYTDFDGDALSAVTAQVEDQVERFGGLVLGPGDQIIDQG